MTLKNFTNPEPSTKRSKKMIEIKKSPTADTRTYDVSKVEKKELLNSSLQHIQDVQKGLFFFQSLLSKAAIDHDYDKITEIDWFYSEFREEFRTKTWLENHYKIHRHHLAAETGVPSDVNLIDVIEYIVDCTMAGKARTGKVFDIAMTPDFMMRAFENTCKIIDNEVIVQEAANANQD